MIYDPIQAAREWFEAFFHATPQIPLEKDFYQLAARAADKHVREQASEIEWMLYTATFYEVAVKLYSERLRSIQQSRFGRL